MESTVSWVHPFWAIAIPVLMSVPLGWLMARLLDVPADREGKGIDALPMLICRLMGRRSAAQMGWKRYACALVTFSAVAWVLGFALLYFQNHLPLNPDGKGSLAALGYKDAAGVQHDGADTAVIFHTVSTFLTNTQQQHYSGEQHLTYASQLGWIVWMDFISPAIGLAVMLAVIRGLRGDRHLGDYYVDMVRIVLLVFMPLAFILALVLVGTGVPMTLQGSVPAATVDGAATKMETQTITRGPVAAFVSMKQLGTNGGGYFGPNSAHPFENAGPWCNILEETAILLLPAAAIVMLGYMLKNLRHAAVIYGVMLALLLAGVIATVVLEVQPSAATAGLPVARGPNMEGKEVRFGPESSATWACMITATANGSVNAMLDSFNPLAGMIPMSFMMLNVAFSGVGCGFLNMLMFIIIAVFLSALMVGRSPEYLGKKLEARETKLAMLSVLFHPLLICFGTALFAATAWGTKTVANPGSHGYSEILYEFASASSNNGSGFEGLGDNTPAWNIACGLVILLNRYGPMILPLAIAGSMSLKKRVPQTAGTLRTDTPTFFWMLMGTVLLVGVLSFMPFVVLGPVADHLSNPSASASTAPAPEATPAPAAAGAPAPVPPGVVDSGDHSSPIAAAEPATSRPPRLSP
ncbi:MAG: potassium-transporting ATPase subunit KdpA [Isosphaeraceae bacterium]|nr:potassium-transporting ATPase subunit KdpA [Isosphaeraceae bacterium]